MSVSRKKTNQTALSLSDHRVSVRCIHLRHSHPGARQRSRSTSSVRGTVYPLCIHACRRPRAHTRLSGLKPGDGMPSHRRSVRHAGNPARRDGRTAAEKVSLSDTTPHGPRQHPDRTTRSGVRLSRGGGTSLPVSVSGNRRASVGVSARRIALPSLEEKPASNIRKYRIKTILILKNQ